MNHYRSILNLVSEKRKGLAVLIDPDKFDKSEMRDFIDRIPIDTTHLFVGGSTMVNDRTKETVNSIRSHSNLPIFLFPGDYSQITPEADAILFLSLLSGRNAEYLIGQHVKSIPKLLNTTIEIIPTGYLLLDGGNQSAVARVSNTFPMLQSNIKMIVHTALAGQYLGAKLIYLEAGSGAKFPVKLEVISEVKKAINLPLIVGGGIISEAQKQEAYDAGADLIVMGTVFESKPNL